MARRRRRRRPVRRDRYGRYRGTGAVKPWKNNNPNFGRSGKAGSARYASSFRAKPIKKSSKGKKAAIAAGTALLVGGAAYGGYRMGQRSRVSTNQAGIVPSTATPTRSPQGSVKVRPGSGRSLRTAKPVPGVTSTSAASSVAGSAAPRKIIPDKVTQKVAGNPVVQAGVAKVQSLRTPPKINAATLVGSAVTAQQVTRIVAGGVSDAKREMAMAGFVEEWDPYRKKFSMVEHDMASASQAAEASGRRMFSAYSGNGPAPKTPGTVTKPNAEKAVPVEQDKEPPKKIASTGAAKTVDNRSYQDIPKSEDQLAVPTRPVVEPKVSIPRPSTFSMAGNNTLIPRQDAGAYQLIEDHRNRLNTGYTPPVKAPTARPQNPVPTPPKAAPAVETVKPVPKAAQKTTAGVKVDAPKKRGRPRTVDSPDVLTPEQTEALRQRARQLNAQRSAGETNPFGLATPGGRPKPVAGVKVDSAPQTKPSAPKSKAMSVEDYYKVAANAMKSGDPDELYEYLDNQSSAGVQLPREARAWMKNFEEGTFAGQEATTLGRHVKPKSESEKKASAAAAELRRVEAAKKKRQKAGA